MALFWATSYPIGVFSNHTPEAPMWCGFYGFSFFGGYYSLSHKNFLNSTKKFSSGCPGFFGFVVHNYLMFIGLQFTTAIKGALINGAIPIVVMGLDFLLFRIVIKPAMLVGSIISFIGVLLIITDGQLGEAMKSGIGFGEALFLVAIVGWGFYSIIAKPLLDKNPAIWITAFPCLFGGILLMPFLMQNLENPMIMLTNRHVVLVLVVQGLLTMGLGFLWYYEGIKELGTASASMYLNLVPVFGTGLAYILVNEQLSKTIIFGGILTIFGVIWVNWCRINDTSKNQS